MTEVSNQLRLFSVSEVCELLGIQHHDRLCYLWNGPSPRMRRPSMVGKQYVLTIEDVSTAASLLGIDLDQKLGVKTQDSFDARYSRPLTEMQAQLVIIGRLEQLIELTKMLVVKVEDSKHG